MQWCTCHCRARIARSVGRVVGVRLESRRACLHSSSGLSSQEPRLAVRASADAIPSEVGLVHDSEQGPMTNIEEGRLVLVHSCFLTWSVLRWPQSSRIF